MGDIYMTQSMGRKLTKLVVSCLVIILSLMAVIFAQSYFGRQTLREAERRALKTLVTSQRAGCRRARQDNRDNAMGWRTEQRARMVTLSEELDIPLKEVRHLIPQPAKKNDSSSLTAIRRYNKIAHGLEQRSEINCAKAFPK